MKQAVAACLALLLTSSLTAAAEKADRATEQPVDVKIEAVQGHSADCQTVHLATNDSTSQVYDAWVTWEKEGDLWCHRYYVKIEKLEPGEARFLGCEEGYRLAAVKAAPATELAVAVAQDLSPRR